jgi:hypothetical protein
VSSPSRAATTKVVISLLESSTGDVTCVNRGWETDMVATRYRAEVIREFAGGGGTLRSMQREMLVQSVSYVPMGRNSIYLSRVS